jgi:ubiquinone/menaquinone biosynthesis C-methylase UbiE
MNRLGHLLGRVPVSSEKRANFVHQNSLLSQSTQLQPSCKNPQKEIEVRHPRKREIADTGKSRLRLPRPRPTLGRNAVSAMESRYIERKTGAARPTPERRTAAGEAESACEAAWLRGAKGELPRFIPFLAKECGLEFRGRILEIGAGSGWLSAELSKQPRVVEIVTTDLSPRCLKEQTPKVFGLLNARPAKITRMPADYHHLDFPNNHFDFVVSSAVLHDAANIVQVLREAKRVLKPGGRFVALREPVWPLVKLKSRSRMLAKLVATGVNEKFFTLADYKEFFRQAALPLEVKRVNLSSGLKYYVDKMVNGLTHARYAFIGVKRGPAAHSTTSAKSARPASTLAHPRR